MAIKLEKEAEARLVPPLRRHFREEPDQQLSELRAQLLLGCLLGKVAPLAGNRHAEACFRAKAEDLAGSCFEPELTYRLPQRSAGRPPQPPR